MQCAFCGTENRPGYKFCGMCGVKLERRHAERRERQNGLGKKCASCGEANEPEVKFCVMCGTRLERRVQERRGHDGGQTRAAAIANAQLPPPEVAGRTITEPAPRAAVATPDLPPAGPRQEPAIFRNEPPGGAHVSGPSFLGLNSQPEGDGEYLLEDEPTGSGLRKLVLLVILAAILGLIFVQWRSSFRANPKPAPTKAEPTASPAPQGSSQPPASANPDQPPKDASAAAGSNDAGTVKDVKNEAGNPIASTPPGDATGSSDTAAAGDDKKPPESDAAAAEAKSPDTAKITDNKPSVALLRAQQYLQGRGVAQNCEQGLLYLRAATDKNEPGAAIQMAALYSSGHCVKQDRVMAYRWFNSAHELEPANMWIQKNMDQLWAQMSSQERRLAGY
jgi:hypothetical protein